MPHSLPHSRRAFTLVELLVTVAILGVLAALIVPAANSALAKGRNIVSVSRLRQLGAATQLYAQDNDGAFPRSSHSAFRRRQPAWSIALLPYLGHDGDYSNQQALQIFNTEFRDPDDASTDPNIWSYALNVYFELDPNYDDYDDAPAQWSTIYNLPRPAATVLLAECKPVLNGDHFMCHQWSGLQSAQNAIDHQRHGKTSNYLFVDGHVESLAVEQVFNPEVDINSFHPNKAGNSDRQ
ncbi:MAG: prepilin-type N-terminal cleavage/methylation domain-containing protein [Verrucomicrobiales bacterium]|jgi:prepilin-type N-terminal cleavage/methylation domain-containing protein/prepilin-type processing-associated H-X9-DG protein|nr:prepilin-type N-terminal cleavage/methylation domain-containing protein [Verrucomicrobiales bacterium]